jgi:hypothetical protein
VISSTTSRFGYFGRRAKCSERNAAGTRSTEASC